MSIYYHAWHFAFRPAGGLDDGRLELLTRWVRKQQWHLLVTEGSGERRHAHVLIVSVKVTPSTMGGPYDITFYHSS